MLVKTIIDFNVLIDHCLAFERLVSTIASKNWTELKYLVYDNYISIGLQMWQHNAVHKVGKPSAFYQWNRCRTGIYLGFAFSVQIWPPWKMHALVKCAATSRSRRLICSVARVSTSQVSCCIEKTSWKRAGYLFRVHFFQNSRTLLKFLYIQT